MSIEIILLQAINTKDKSDIRGYLKYQDCRFMYFPNKVFIQFLQNVDVSVKQVIKPTSFSEHESNLIKVRPVTNLQWNLLIMVTFSTKSFWPRQEGQIFSA